jgi:hypothetical protein
MKERGVHGPRLAELPPLQKLAEENGRSKHHHPAISFFQVLLQHFGGQMAQFQERLAEDEEGSDDDGFLTITFSSIEEVNEFYQRDGGDFDDWNDDDSSHDLGREDASGRMWGEENSFDNVEDDDAIVSSWIDNYHFLIAEQESRKRKQMRKQNENQKHVRFDTSSRIDCTSDAIVFLVGDECGDDECSLALSCCSSRAEASCHSLDTIEQQEFEEFANEWRNRQAHGKNTDQSLLGLLIREILVGPLDEDFEVMDDDDDDDDDDDTFANENYEIDPGEIFHSECGFDGGGLFPSDLLLSIET